jgi:two-component system chemotaxis family response regulator WspR
MVMSIDSQSDVSDRASDPEEQWQDHILLCLEHQQNCRLLAALLEKRYTIETSLAESGDLPKSFDLCILDVASFGRLAPQIAAQRATTSPVFVPFLLLVRRSHLPLLTAEQRRQVDDVIMLPVDQIELLLRAESLLRARRQSLQLNALLAQERLLEEQLQADNQALQLMAVQDSLTGLANRRAFDHKLTYEWRLRRREQTPLAIILCDVDHFKAYNDTYGHIMGDQCLRAVSAVLDAVIRRPADMVARYGGEEFALILPNTDMEGALFIAQCIQQALRARALPHPNSSTGQFVSLSFGVAVVVPHQLLQIDDLLRSADVALYQAKAEGRDRICVTPE